MSSLASKIAAAHQSSLPLRITSIATAVLIAASVSACTLGSPGAVIPPQPADSAAPGAGVPVRPGGSSVVFDHFTVTASRIDTGASPDQVLLVAKVCVTSLPSSYIGKRIRVSWDPWSLTSGAASAGPGYRGKIPSGIFRADGDYKVGGCVSGRIPFETAGNPDTVRYANAVGDEAIWDAASLITKSHN